MLTLLSSPIGNIQDISYRAVLSIETSQIVLCEDTRVTKKLFFLIEDKLSHPLHIKEKQFFSFHAHNENTFLEKTTIDFDQNVVYLSDAGTPCISDPGAVLVNHCIKNNISYDFIGGVSAFLSAFVLSGFLHSQFLFYGFLPKKGSVRSKQLSYCMSLPYICVFYEAPHRIVDLLDEITALHPERTVFVAKEITKMYQKSYKGTATEVKEYLQTISTKGEWVVLVDRQEYSHTNEVTKDDILALDIPKKQKAKLIAKITGEEIKRLYEELL